MSLRAKPPIAFSTCLLRSHVNLAPFWTNIRLNKYSFEQIFFWTNILLNKCPFDKMFYWTNFVFPLRSTKLHQTMVFMHGWVFDIFDISKEEKMYFSLKNSPRSELITESLSRSRTFCEMIKSDLGLGCSLNNVR